MSRPVDVLAILDEAEGVLRMDRYQAIPDDLIEVRAAVAELIEAASEVRTTLSITRSNVMTEIKRGAKQWEGVPELLQARIETFDAALARVRGAS